MSADMNFSHEQKAIEAIGLAYGLLWMIDPQSDVAKTAYEFLKSSLDRSAKTTGIKAAMDAGFCAQEPSGWE